MRVVAARVPGGPPGRLLYRPQRVRPLHPRVQHRAADDPGFYNQNMQLFQTPDQVVVLNGDGPRRAHRSPRGRPRLDIRVVDRRVERPLGRRHAGGRDHALQRQGLPEPSRHQAPAPRRAAGADCAEGGPLRSVPQGRCVATPSRPRSRRCRERSPAHAESGPCHQIGNDRPRLAPVGQAGQRDRWGGCVMIRDQLDKPAR